MNDDELDAIEVRLRAVLNASARYNLTSAEDADAMLSARMAGVTANHKLHEQAFANLTDLPSDTHRLREALQEAEGVLRADGHSVFADNAARALGD